MRDADDAGVPEPAAGRVIAVKPGNALPPGLYWWWGKDAPTPVLAHRTGYGHWRTWRTGSALPEPEYAEAVTPPGRGP